MDKDRYRIRYWADLGGGYSRHTVTVRGTRREAEAKLAELRTEHERKPGEPVRRASRRMTVGEVWEEYVLPDYEDRLGTGECSKSTLRAYRSSWRASVAPTWASVPVLEVAPRDVQPWLLSMSAGSAKLARKVLNAIMSKAVFLSEAPSNPLSMRYRMPRDVDSPSKDVYALDEIGEALRAVRGSVIEPAVVLMGLGSCRVGESLGVMLSEVELREVDGVPVALARIARQVDRAGRVSDSLKTPQSLRTVVVPGPPALRLSSIVSDLASRGLAWLCDDGCGAPVSQAALGRQWTRLLDAAGVERIPVRNLRNSWATNSRWTLGIETSMVERMMGHAGKTVTERYYDRPDEDMFAESVAKAYKSHPFADTWDI